ncbi:MAG: DegT/DnrJ/EryC1/StrS family aminotransferase [Chloroflexi bacterium]|nr:DegT/DnrJ/EryC1/StrS family aminotransferase [Chloroflexota bacterium]
MAKPEPIPVFKPCYDEEEVQAVAEVLRSGWIGLGPRTRQFEHAFAGYVEAPFAVATNSATAALHLALKVANVEGHEVITTPMTFVSTNHAILYNNGIPVFADIEPDTLNVDVRSVEELLSPRTRAIVVVHYGGHACDMDAIMELARLRGIPVIEDAAHACGAQYKGKRIGGLGNLTCFSFHAVKNLATGDGGMITCTDPQVAERLDHLRWVGISKDTWRRAGEETRYSWFYGVEDVGFKYHMNDIAAALGLVQLAKLDRTNARRREIVARYNQGFAGLEWLETPVEKPYAHSSWHNYVVKAERRDELIQFLGERGISAGMHYYPNHLYEIYEPYRRPLPVTDRVWRRLVTLPLFPDLTDSQVEHIIETVRSFGAQRLT